MLITIFGPLRGQLQRVQFAFNRTQHNSTLLLRNSLLLALTWNTFRKHTKLSEKPRKIQNIAFVRLNRRFSQKDCKEMETSGLTHIEKYPDDPVEMFQDVLCHVPKSVLITFNLATMDCELGILNRTLVYRGLTDGHITFVTQRNTRKYQNLKENPKCALTFLFPELEIEGTAAPVTWQVRLWDATVEELNAEDTKKLWQKDPLFAKIRAHICECGAPVDLNKLKADHDKLLKQAQSGVELPQPETYVAFTVKPNRWDFYKAESMKIGDRVLYSRANSDDCWKARHVAA